MGTFHVLREVREGMKPNLSLHKKTGNLAGFLAQMPFASGSGSLGVTRASMIFWREQPFYLFWKRGSNLVLILLAWDQNPCYSPSSPKYFLFPEMGVTDRWVGVGFDGKPFISCNLERFVAALEKRAPFLALFISSPDKLEKTARMSFMALRDLGLGLVKMRISSTYI